MKTKVKLPSPLTLAWCRANTEIVQEMNAKFDKEKNPSHWHRKGSPDYWKTKLAAHKLRAVRLNRLPSWSDQDEIADIFKNCPDDLEIEHIIPIGGELVSGLHVPNNLAYLSAKQNASKGNKYKPRNSIIYRATISLF
jgi:hypothetical protein